MKLIRFDFYPPFSSIFLIIYYYYYYLSIRRIVVVHLENIFEIRSFGFEKICNENICQGKAKKRICKCEF